MAFATAWKPSEYSEFTLQIYPASGKTAALPSSYCWPSILPCSFSCGNGGLIPPPSRKTTLVFLLSFSVFRLLLDSLRELPMVNGWINIHQLGSITILLITVYTLIMIRLQKSSREG